VSVRQPEQGQKSDDYRLADKRIAIAEKGEQPANNRSFQQIEQVHNTVAGPYRASFMPLGNSPDAKDANTDAGMQVR
jgi:hypothetical protein